MSFERLNMGKLIKLSEWLQRRAEKLEKFARKYPRLKHYAEVKKQYPATILFYRIGDFYEVFQDEAIVTARILNVNITTDGLPMCGVPVNDAARHLKKMTRAGYRVATCETVEDKSSPTGLINIYTRIVKNERKGKQRVFRLSGGPSLNHAPAAGGQEARQKE